MGGWLGGGGDASDPSSKAAVFSSARGQDCPQRCLTVRLLLLLVKTLPPDITRMNKLLSNDMQVLTYLVSCVVIWHKVNLLYK